MALIRLEAHHVLHFLKIGNTIVCTWPYDIADGKFAFVLSEVNWCCCVFFIISVMIGSVGIIYFQRDDIKTILKSAAQLCAFMEIMCNFILCKLQRQRIQYLLKELKDFIWTYNDQERTVLQKYIDRYSGFYMYMLMWHVLAVIAFSCGPLYLPIMLPAEAWYPFLMDSPVIIHIIYIIQVYSIVLVGVGLSVDFMFSTFFFFFAARLEILGLEVQNAKNEEQINFCIRKHQRIIRFVDDTKRAAQYILFKTNITMGLGVIFAAIPLIQKDSSDSSFNFVFIAFGACQRLYVTAWPADDLKGNSEQFATELYNTPWIERSSAFNKNIHFMIQRCQKPLVISMGAFLPVLSLEYYLKYITTIFSYFTTIRAVIDE